MKESGLFAVTTGLGVGPLLNSPSNLADDREFIVHPVLRVAWPVRHAANHDLVHHAHRSDQPDAMDGTKLNGIGVAERRRWLFPIANSRHQRPARRWSGPSPEHCSQSLLELLARPPGQTPPPWPLEWESRVRARACTTSSQSRGPRAAPMMSFSFRCLTKPESCWPSWQRTVR